MSRVASAGPMPLRARMKKGAAINVILHGHVIEVDVAGRAIDEVGGL